MNWNLNENQFTVLDRLKVAGFFLNPKNRWTQDVKVKEFEQKMADYVGCKYAVFVSSGSTANTLLAMWVKDNLASEQKNIVVLPAVTWQTSCSPWIREGFDPIFVDVNLKSLSIDLDKLEQTLSLFSNRVAAVFITSLLGFSPDMARILKLTDKYPSIKFLMDNCEATLTKAKVNGVESNVSSYLTSTTSTYFGHQICSTEGGFIFTNKLDKYIYILMARNHGMVRSINAYKDILGEELTLDNFNMRKNDSVDHRFDFYSLGNNFRNTEINAYLGLLDIERTKQYEQYRAFIYSVFKSNLNKDLFILPKDESETSLCIPFSLPIIFNPDIFGVNPSLKTACIGLLDTLSIESRPIISGNLLRQTAYKHYGDYLKYPNAEILHNNGLYVGLHNKVDVLMVKELCSELNKFAEKALKK